jgi:hypothetical protein
VGYERSLAEIVGPEAARRWLERGVTQRELPPIAGGSHLEDLRRTRLEQLRAMTDEQFAAEMREHQAARWRPSALREHAKKHWRDFEDAMGHGLGPSELQEMSSAALRSWDRLLTGIDPGFRQITYTFVTRLTGGGAILVVITRGQWIRTAIPVDDFDRWLGRHGNLVEVTDRAKRLGI